MAITQTSDVASIIEKRVSAIVTEALQQESVMLGAVRDFTSQVGPGMDTLKIPLFAPLAIQNVSETAEMTPQTASVLTADLVLNQHKSIPFSISDKTNVQSKVNIITEVVKMGARSLASQVDDYVLGLLVANYNAGTPEALTSSALADILSAKEYLDGNNVPKMGRYLECSPAFIAKLLADNSVINANKYGSTDPVQAGFVTKIYGFMLLESSSAALGDGFVAHSGDAMAFARQIMPKFEQDRNVLGQRWDYALTHLYGAKATDASGSRVIAFA
jgi:N4-gp56 family major capsid protein